MTTFATRQDVLDFYGATDEQHLDKRVYKATECGAWAKFDTRFVKTGTKPVAYTAVIQKGINGVYILSVAEGCEPAPPADNPEALFGLPQLVKSFLNLDANKPKANRSLISAQEFDDLRSWGTLTVKDESPIRKIVTFIIEVDTGDTQDGFLIGSIVEGSEAECTPHFLPFPFTGEDLDNAVQALETQADELWNEANAE